MHYCYYYLLFFTQVGTMLLFWILWLWVVTILSSSNISSVYIFFQVRPSNFFYVSSRYSPTFQTLLFRIMILKSNGIIAIDHAVLFVFFCTTYMPKDFLYYFSLKLVNYVDWNTIVFALVDFKDLHCKWCINQHCVSSNFWIYIY